MSGNAHVKLTLNNEQAELWSKLTRLQKSFIREYLSGKPKYKAYKDAGAKCSSDNSYHSSSSKTLRNVNVKAFLWAIKPNLYNKFNDEIAPAIMDAKERMERLTNYGRGNITSIINFGMNGDQPYANIKESEQLDKKITDTIKDLKITAGGFSLTIHDPIKAITQLNEMDKILESDDDEIIPTFKDVIDDIKSRS